MKPGFLSANLSYTKALGDLHDLLARRSANIFLLIKVMQPEKLIFSKGDFSKLWHHSPKALDKVAFIQGKGAVGYNKERI